MSLAHISTCPSLVTRLHFQITASKRSRPAFGKFWHLSIDHQTLRLSPLARISRIHFRIQRSFNIFYCYPGRCVQLNIRFCCMQRDEISIQYARWCTSVYTQPVR